MASRTGPLNFLVRAFVIGVTVFAIIIGSMVVYMKLYGNAIVEKSLSAMLGSQVKFRSASINLEKGSVNFNGFSIVSEVDLTSEAFNAEKVTVFLNKEKFDKEKRIVLDELYVKKATLTVERKKSGALILGAARARDAGGHDGIAYAEEAPGSAFYNFAKGMRKVTIEDSIVNFKDGLVTLYQKPYGIYCDRLNVNIVSQQVPDPAGSIPVTMTVSFRIPTVETGNGTFALAANMAVYPDRTDMEATLDTRQVNLMLFLPYLTRSTPFLFYEGFFNSHTDFRMHQRTIDSLTTIIFQRLRVAIKPGMDNGQFLAASVNQLAKYLTSSGGEVVFDFVIQGPAHKPALGLGPKVKFAIGMVVIEEVAKMMQQIQQMQR